MSWLTIAWTFAASACLTLALVQLVIWLKRREDVVHLLLALTALGAAGCGHGDIPMSVEAMKRGAEHFLTKPVDESQLLAAVQRALERNRHQQAALEEETKIRRRVDQLSTRELEVMRYLLTGALNKQIAAHLGIVEKTVKVHRARVFEKMGVHSVAELVRLCSQIGEEPPML